MSGHSPGHVWQGAELATSFLDERATLLPMREVQEDLIRELLARHPHTPGRFLDIGSGDGAASELVLAACPGSHAMLVDFSEPMLSRAGVRLGAYDGRWETVRADLSSPDWSAKLPAGPFDAAVSCYAIHHLPSERKRALFGELARLLAPGAMFLNMDVVTVNGPLQGYFDEQMAVRAIAAERRRGGSRSDEEVAARFTADNDEDRPDGAIDQLVWLAQAGFEDVELHFKWAEGVVYGGVAPADGSE